MSCLCGNPECYSCGRAQGTLRTSGKRPERADWEVCACCDTQARDVHPRTPTGYALCDACWTDPAIRYADCRHGAPERTPNLSASSSSNPAPSASDASQEEPYRVTAPVRSASGKTRTWFDEGQRVSEIECAACKRGEHGLCFRVIEQPKRRRVLLCSCDCGLPE